MPQGATDAEFAPPAPVVSGGGPEGGGRKGAPDVPRTVSEFLRGFAMGLHRFAMYPAGHPSLLPVAERMLLQLSGVLGERPALTLGVGSRQILVDEASTPEDHPVMSDLAARLHAQQLGALVFRRGVDREELLSLLDVLARDPVRGERPLGLLPLRDRPSWPHIHLLPVEYGALELAGHAGKGMLPVSELWIALFHSVFLRGALDALDFDPDTLEPGGELPSGARLAELAESWAEEALSDRGEAGSTEAGPAVGEDAAATARTLMEGLGELVRDLQWAGPVEGAGLRVRISEFLVAFDPELLARVMREGTDVQARTSLVQHACRAGLTSDAVLRVVDAANVAEGRRLSAPMTRLLGKMARRGESSRPGIGRSEARSALREQIDRLVTVDDGDRASPADPGPSRTAVPASADGREGPDDDASDEEPLTVPTPFRVLELAIRLDEPGPVLDAALAACVRAGDVAAVLDLAEGTPSDSRAAARVEAYIFTPERLTELLSGPDVEVVSMRRIVDALGDDAIEPLFERLVGSESRAVRRKIFDRLAALGPRIAPIILRHLSSDAWYVQRNMLALLQLMPALPPGFSPVQHMLTDDVRVRREALPLAFRDPGSREEALELALRDTDERVVRSGLLELQEGVPDAVVPVLVANVLEGERLDHLRSLAARALGRSRSPAARDALVRACTDERGLLGRKRRLGLASPVVVSALHALAQGWSGDPEVRWVLEAGLHAEDPRLRAAAGGAGSADPSGDRPSVSGERGS